MVPEGKAAGGAANRPSHQLMAQADREDGVTLQQALHQLHLGSKAGGVTGTIGQHYPVGTELGDLIQRGRRWT